MLGPLATENLIGFLGPITVLLAFGVLLDRVFFPFDAKRDEQARFREPYVLTPSADETLKYIFNEFERFFGRRFSPKFIVRVAVLSVFIFLTLVFMQGISFDSPQPVDAVTLIAICAVVNVLVDCISLSVTQVFMQAIVKTKGFFSTVIALAADLLLSLRISTVAVGVMLGVLLPIYIQAKNKAYSGALVNANFTIEQLQDSLDGEVFRINLNVSHPGRAAIAFPERGENAFSFGTFVAQVDKEFDFLPFFNRSGALSVQNATLYAIKNDQEELEQIAISEDGRDPTSRAKIFEEAKKQGELSLISYSGSRRPFVLDKRSAVASSMKQTFEIEASLLNAPFEAWSEVRPPIGLLTGANALGFTPFFQTLYCTIEKPNSENVSDESTATTSPEDCASSLRILSGRQNSSYIDYFADHIHSFFPPIPIGAMLVTSMVFTAFAYSAVAVSFIVRILHFFAMRTQPSTRRLFFRAPFSISCVVFGVCLSTCLSAFS